MTSVGSATRLSKKCHGRDYEDQTDVARWIEDLARGILRELGLPTETEANLDLDVGELPGDRWICSGPFGMKLQA